MVAKKKAAEPKAAEPKAAEPKADMADEAMRLVTVFREATPAVLEGLIAGIKQIDEEIAELQGQRRGIEVLRKSVAWKINGRPRQTTASEQKSRREAIFRCLQGCDEEDGLNKAAIAERTGIPMGAVTTALKDQSFVCEGRKWQISEEYRRRLAEAQGR